VITSAFEFGADGRHGFLRLHHVSGEPLTFANVFARWRGDAEFVVEFSRWLAIAPWAAAFWELPSLSRTTLTRPFECVLVDSPALAGTVANPSDFAAPFAQSVGEVACFDNLGGDARLIAPRPAGDDGACAHLLDFLREVEEPRCQALWQTLGLEIERRLDERPLWISTSGLGVPWLHLRLDRRPKYYTHAPYRAAPPAV